MSPGAGQPYLRRPTCTGATGATSPSQAADVFTRRSALSGACLLAITVSVSGCSGRDEASALAPGTTLASTTEIPVGAGTVFPEYRVVVTHPAKGTFRAFSAVCTHQGCIVQEVTDGSINCPCHGSRFDIADGSVVRGPAQQPLTPLPVAVEGSGITAV
jgi:Rieske Fe-S protein